MNTFQIHQVLSFQRCRCTHLRSNPLPSRISLAHTRYMQQIPLVACSCLNHMKSTLQCRRIPSFRRCKRTHSRKNPAPPKTCRSRTECMDQTQVLFCRCRNHTTSMFQSRPAQWIQRCKCTHSNPNPSLPKTCRSHTQYIQQILLLSCIFQYHTMHTLHPRWVQLFQHCKYTHSKLKQ